MVVLKGDVGEFPVSELLRFVREGRRKGVLTVRRGGEVGEIYFAGGSVVGAVLGREVGGKVLAEIARWRDGVFTIEYFAPTDADGSGVTPSTLFSQ